jgi:hypothetical protein
MRGSRRALAVVLVIAGCAGPGPSAASPSPISPAASSTAASTSEASTSPSLDPLPAPASPYSAAEILEAMRDSRRPGGVPDEIETDAVAAAVAAAVVTLGGEPWDALAIGGACGPEWCTLDVAGTRDGEDVADAWTLAVFRSGDEVEVVETDLHLLPDGVADRLDTLARGSEASAALDGLLLASVRWLPPPDEERFVLAYRAGDEEGSCERDVTLDESGSLVRVDSRGC